jgi:peroxiredoxin
MPEQLPASTIKTRFIRYRFFVLAALVLGLAVLSIAALNRIDTQAPDVTFMTVTGQKIALKALRGKPVIVTFWATDCSGCLEEIPQLIDLYTHYHPQGLEIIAVALYYDPPNHVITLTEDQHLPYHVALDLTAEIAHAFGDVQLIPSTFLIAPDGLIALKKTGVFVPAEIKPLIEKFTKG